MSSGLMGGAAGIVLGAALAPATFGASAWAGAAWGFAAGRLIGGLVSQPSIPGHTSEGPRLQDLKVQSASYGRPIPIILGKMRTAGNILWIKTGGLIEEKVEQTTHSGGGKTGGGASSTQIFYNYYATCAIAVCKGPIKAITKIWADSKLVYNAEATDAGTQQANEQFKTYVHGYLGDETQVADSVISYDMGMGNVPGYRGLAYIVLERFPLKDYGNRIPNFTFEVASLVSTKTLANPAGQGDGESSQFSEVTVCNPLPPEIKLALNFNGTDDAGAATDFVDSSSYKKQLTPNGLPRIKTAVKVFGSASGYFPYTNSVLTTGEDNDFNLSASAPWQISFRYRTGNPGHSHILISPYGETPLDGILDGTGWIVNIGGGYFTFSTDGGSNICAVQLDVNPLLADTWSAFRISHDGVGTVRFYKEGEILYHLPSKSGIKSFPLTTFTGKNRINIGNIHSGASVADTHIYLDDFVIQKGGAVTVADYYTVETAETAPTTTTRSQMSGGRTEYADDSGKNRTVISVSGSPSVSAGVKKFGTASRLFNPGDAINYHNATWQYLSTSGTWGIGFCIRFKDSVASAVIMSTGGVSQDGWQIEYHHSVHKIKFTHSASAQVLSWDFFPVADTWYTIGFSKVTTTANTIINPGGFGQYTVPPGIYLRCFINGAMPNIGSNHSDDILTAITNNSGSNFQIGQAGGGTVAYYLDEIVIQDTTAVYTGWDEFGYSSPDFGWVSYPIPAAELSADSNTRLLLHFNQSGNGRWVGGGSAVDTRVSNIISYLCENAGLLDYNTDFIADNDDVAVPGFVMNNIAPVRQSLEMLSAAFFLDIVESASALYFVSRNSLINGGPAALISENDLSARPIAANPTLPLEVTTQQEVEIPKEVRVRYLNPAMDYYEAVQRSVKQQTHSIGSIEINATALALTDSQAKLAAIGNHMFAWAERKKYKFTLPVRYAHLDCGDMVQINYSSQSHFVRITKMDYDAGYFNMEGVGQDFTGRPFNVAADGYSGPISTGIFVEPPATTQGLVVSSTDTRGTEGTPPPATINYPVVSTLLFLDMPIVMDSDDGSGYYVCIDKGKPSNYWPGGVVYKSSDGASFATLLSLASAMTTGQSLTALASGPATLWDMANTVIVALTHGTLASDTEANVLNGANIGILGDEIIQWTSAVLDDNGNYILSGLLRGRRGTEWAVDSHAAGERFVLFNSSSVQRATGVNEEIGLQRIYRAVTVGLNLADQASQNFTNTAKGLKPYSPCQITGSRDGSNNLVIHWIRRTRVGGSWKDNVDVSLGEASEQYAVDILCGATRSAKMASNTAPSGYVASASTELNSGRAAWKAFDRGTNAASHGWYTTVNTSGWLAYEFPSAVILGQYSMTALTDVLEATYNPKTWTFEGWTGSAWIILDTQTNVTAWRPDEKRNYSFSNAMAFAKYRLDITSNQGGGWLGIQQVELLLAPIVRSMTGITSPTTSYTASEQTQDGFTPGDPISVSIYQISSTVGRGYAGANTL